MLTTYLGQKGYTLLKKELTGEQYKQIKDDLLIRPFTGGQGGGGKPVTFPVYRESPQKIYVPHYYGITQFGPPTQNKLSEGDDISLSFAGTLRDTQVPVVEKYLRHVAIGGSGLLELPCGFGKCLGKGTRVMLAGGNIEVVENIRTGDVLMGDDSTPRNVLSIARGQEQMYKIVNQVTGEYYVVNESHILSLTRVDDNMVVDIAVTDYLQLPQSNRDMLYGYKVPVQFTEKKIDVDPYLVGQQLLTHIPYHYKCNSRDIRLKVLDGIIEVSGIQHHDNIIIIQQNKTFAEDIVYLCRSLGFECSTESFNCSNEIFNNPVSYNRICISGLIKPYPIIVEKMDVNNYYGFEIDGNKRFVLGDFSVTHNTSISLYILSKIQKKTIVIVHKEFLMNQWIERITQFLPGARIGKIQGQIIDIENKDIVLCMLQSLVLKEYPAETFTSFGLTILDEVHHISSQTFSTALFKLVTKYMLGLSATMERKDGTTKVFKMFLGEIVHKVENKTDTLVEVRAVTYKSSDPEFNEIILDYKGQPQISSMISKLCSYSRRTEFILNVLTDYLLADNISKEEAAQHKLGMDGMNQACKMCGNSNNYLLKNTCCGVVHYCLLCLHKIVEEARVPEIVVNKKTGDKREVKRRAKCPDCLKSLEYEQHYIENPYIKSLSQVHIIIMSHNLNVLEYMYNKIVCKNYASVGYYVGGMGESELKQTEKKQVILASYSMAQEGLDIPSLNTEFLISPKTDVVQIVGRILRAKHAYTSPIIYDFVDTHDVFYRQWLKRKAYYKKQGYRIVGPNDNTQHITKCMLKIKKSV